MITQILLAKIILVVFFSAGLIIIYKKISRRWFIILLGLTAASGYVALIKNLALPLWGLQGDEVTIGAMFATFAKISFASDFAYHHLPAFYPPFYFWAIAWLGKLLSWNGVTMMKVGTTVCLFLLPTLTYFGQKLFWTKADQTDQPGPIAWLIFSAGIFTIIDTDVIITKPYEVLTAALAVLWLTFLLSTVTQEKFSKLKIIFFSLTGGLLFMTYYLWLIFAAIATSFYGLSLAKKDQLNFYGRLLAVGLLTLLFASPYLGPLVYNYMQSGTENWSTAFFVNKNIGLYAADLFVFNWTGLLLLAGLFSLIYYRDKIFIKPSLYLFISGYVWWLLGLILILFFQSPIQEAKAFYVFNRVVLAYGLAYGLEQCWQYCLSRWPMVQKPILILGLIFLALALPAGRFADDAVVQDHLNQSRNVNQNLLTLSNFLNQQSEDLLTLQSGLVQLPSFTPINQFIYFNQHNNHPAAHFSERYAYINLLANALSPEEFYQLSNSPYGEIKQLIFINKKNSDYYPLYFHLDNFGTGIEEKTINIPKKLITQPYFKKIYDQDDLIIWQRN